MEDYQFKNDFNEVENVSFGQEDTEVDKAPVDTGDFYNPDFNAPVTAEHGTPAPENAQVSKVLDTSKVLDAEVPDAGPSKIEMASQAAASSVEKTLMKAEQLIEASGVSEELQTAGLGKLKGKHIRNFLMAFALWKMMGTMKKNLPIILVGGAAFVAYRNRGRFMGESKEIAMNYQPAEFTSLV